MTDDWQWFWASESGRDHILRDEVEGLHARLSSTSAQASRLSSQLANLSGSIESRLNALSRAFDAYVELGDVREELGAYEEPAAVRRAVMSAIEALAAGRPAAPVDARELDYWLPYAMNAVIGLAEGRGDGGELERARALAMETDLFVVAAGGALGHGGAVADLLPSVLTGDTELTLHQRAVWRATAAGIFGDLTDGLADGLGAVWRPLLDREAGTEWSAWVRGHGATPSAGISLLRTLVTDPAALPPDPGADSLPADGTLSAGFATSTTPPAHDRPPTDGLRATVTELIGRGMPAEAELLRRARELRTLIEEPSSRAAKGKEVEPVTVVSEVRLALLAPTTSPAARTTLISWVAPSLVGVLDELTAAAQAAPSAHETLRGSGGVIEVTPSGADQAAVTAGLARLEAAYEVSNRPLIGWAVGTGLAALLTLVLAIAGSGWAWLFAVVLVIGVVGTARQLRTRRATQHAGLDAIQRLHQDIDAATAKVESTERQRSALLIQLTGEAADLRALLARPADRDEVSPAGDR